MKKSPSYLHAVRVAYKKKILKHFIKNDPNAYLGHAFLTAGQIYNIIPFFKVPQAAL